MGSIGLSELTVILLVALLLFGPRRLPELARSLGSAIREFRRALRSISASIDDTDESHS